jgi:transposase
MQSCSCCAHAATEEANELEQEIPRPRPSGRSQLLDEAGEVDHRRATDRYLVAPGRVRSEAAFSRLAGVAPLPASSGQTIRHRPLRNVNAALRQLRLRWPIVGRPRNTSVVPVRSLARPPAGASDRNTAQPNAD